MSKVTIYIAPGPSQCRVYEIPYPMRRGQHPRDLLYKYQSEWNEIGLLNNRLEMVCLDKRYQHLKPQIDGLRPGTFFEADKQEG